MYLGLFPPEKVTRRNYKVSVTKKEVIGQGKLKYPIPILFIIRLAKTIASIDTLIAARRGNNQIILVNKVG